VHDGVLITALTRRLMLVGGHLLIPLRFLHRPGMGFIPLGAILAILVVELLLCFKSFLGLGCRVFSVA